MRVVSDQLVAIPLVIDKKSTMPDKRSVHTIDRLLVKIMVSNGQRQSPLAMKIGQVCVLAQPQDNLIQFRPEVLANQLAVRIILTPRTTTR